jgi:hypothetical protein
LVPEQYIDVSISALNWSSIMEASSKPPSYFLTDEPSSPQSTYPPSYFPPSPTEEPSSPQSTYPPLLHLLSPPTPPPPSDSPPDFAASVNVNPALPLSGEPPYYSRNAAADERIVLAQPVAPRSTETRAPHTEYLFESARMELNMGPKKYPVKVPCYGWNQDIEGYVAVKDFKAATKITVTVCPFHS